MHVKLGVPFLRIFSSPAWDLIREEKHNEMEKNNQPLIFFGYNEDMKTYRVFNHTSKELFF